MVAVLKVEDPCDLVYLRGVINRARWTCKESRLLRYRYYQRKQRDRKKSKGQDT